MENNLQRNKILRPMEDFLDVQPDKSLLLLNITLALIYFIVVVFLFPAGNRVLFWLLIGGEIFHLWQICTFLYTIWDVKVSIPQNSAYMPEVDIFITVAGEPRDVVEQTLKAVLAMKYPKFYVYLLNDGFVTKKENWQEVEVLAKQYKVNAITRTIPGGAKAGNINNGLTHSQSEFVVVFDADHVPHSDFLTKMIPYFSDPKVAFVQSPQFYKNSALNFVTSGSWEQQELFFGAICKGKNRLNSATMCGTNMAVRRSSLLDVGGMCEESIAEDFVTGLFMHQKGLTSVYVGEVLAEGLAPEDFLSYYKQQFRWARGALDVLFKYKLLTMKGLTWQQKIQYLASASFYVSGIIVALNAFIPLVFFFTGQVPFHISTMVLASAFLPYIFVTIYTLARTTNYTYTFQSLAFSMSSFSIHLQALWSTISGEKPKFDITSKKKIEGNFIYLVRPHLIYIFLVIVGIATAVLREGFSPSVAANSAWGIFYIIIFCDFILASLPERKTSSKKAAIIPKVVYN